MNRLSVVAALAMLLGAGSGSASAQVRKAGDIAASYSFVRIAGEADGSAPSGWLFSASRSITPLFAVVGEVAGSYASEDGDAYGFHTFQGGIRVAGPSGHGVRPFAQLLAGVGVVSCCGDYAAGFVMEPGGGVDIPIGRRVAMRLAASVPLAFADGVTELFRAQIGISVDVGQW